LIARSISYSQAWRLAGSRGRKHHADAVLPERRQGHPHAWPFLSRRKPVRQLDHQAGGRPKVSDPSPPRAAVVEVLQDGQALFNDGMRFSLPLMCANEADAAAVVLIGRVIEGPPPPGEIASSCLST